MTDETAVIRDKLRQAGLLSGTDAIEVQPRGDRLLAWLPDDRLAWFPTTPAAAERLHIEDRVLRLVGARCTFRVPQPLVSAPEGWCMRTLVPGTVDPVGFAARLKTDPMLVGRLARFLGSALAQQQLTVSDMGLTMWLRAERLRRTSPGPLGHCGGSGSDRPVRQVRGLPRRGNSDGAAFRSSPCRHC